MIDETLPPYDLPKDPSKRKLIVGGSTILGAGVLGSLGAKFGIERFWHPRKDIMADWESTAADNDSFMKENVDALKNIRLGCSLSPEQLDWLGIHDSPEQVLDFLQENGIKDVRLGIRWNHSVNEKGEVDLSYYAPWIEQSLKRGMNLCLNVGPIKVFRWPEDHVPKSVLEKVKGDKNFPKNGGLIKYDDPLSFESRKYLSSMLPELAKLTQGHTVTIQPENEAQTPFGEHEWVASNDHLFGVVRMILDHFPTSPILLNSPAVKQSKSPIRHSSTLEYTAELAKALVAARSGTKVICGVDVYPDTPQSAEIPLTNGLRVDTQMAVESLRGRNVIPQYVEGMKKSSIRTEITELQVEPWGERDKPGNDVQSLRFAVLRSLPFVDGTQPTTMRLWGIEHLYEQRAKGVETGEHKKIVELIQLINSQDKQS